MIKRIEPSIIENAIETIPGFDVVYKKLQQQVWHRGTIEMAMRAAASMPSLLPALPMRFAVKTRQVHAFHCTHALERGRTPDA